MLSNERKMKLYISMSKLVVQSSSIFVDTKDWQEDSATNIIQQMSTQR